MNGITGGATTPIGAHPAAESALADARRAADDGSAKEAAKAFETVLATMLVREMRRSLPDGLLSGATGSDVYESWFDEHVGRTLAEGKGLGLAGMLEDSIERKRREAGELNEVNQ